MDIEWRALCPISGHSETVHSAGARTRGASFKREQPERDHEQGGRAERQRPMDADEAAENADRDAAERPHAVDDMLYSPMTRPRPRRRMHLHQGLRHRVEREIEESRGEQQDERNWIRGCLARSPRCISTTTPSAPPHSRARRSQPRTLQHETGSERTGGIGAEQHAVVVIRRGRDPMRGEFRHLCLVRAADENDAPPRAASSRRRAVAGDLAHDSRYVAEPRSIGASARRSAAGTVWRLPQPV